MKTYGSQLTQFWHDLLDWLGVTSPFLHKQGLWLVAIAAVILTVAGLFIFAALRR